MADSFSETRAALEQLEAEQVERFKPKRPEPPATEAEALARDLARARSHYPITVDAAEWLR